MRYFVHSVTSVMGTMTPRADRFFFMHLQKTGGTSLNLRLREVFRDTEIYPAVEDRRKGEVVASFDIEGVQHAFDIRGDDIRIVSGHFPLCVRDVVDLPFTTFTILREPVARTLSFLRNVKRQRRYSTVALEDLYARPNWLFGLLTNHMVKMLSLVPSEMTHGARTFVEVGDRHLERAKHRLVHDVDLFGLTEHYDVFWDEVARRYEWDLGESLHVRATVSEPVSDEFRARIARDNRLDVELYSFARRVWEERHPGMHGLTPERPSQDRAKAAHLAHVPPGRP
jgi:Sulfotransferase family